MKIFLKCSQFSTVLEWGIYYSPWPKMVLLKELALPWSLLVLTVFLRPFQLSWKTEQETRSPLLVTGPRLLRKRTKFGVFYLPGLGTVPFPSCPPWQTSMWYWDPSFFFSPQCLFCSSYVKKSQSECFFISLWELGHLNFTHIRIFPWWPNIVAKMFWELFLHH